MQYNLSLRNQEIFAEPFDSVDEAVAVYNDVVRLAGHLLDEDQVAVKLRCLGLGTHVVLHPGITVAEVNRELDCVREWQLVEGPAIRQALKRPNLRLV